MKSVRRHLQLWVLGALGLGSLCLLGGTYALELEELNEIFDENLKQVALSAASQSGFPEAGPQRLPDALPRFMEVDRQLNFVTQVYDRDGRLRFSSHPDITLPPGQASGLRGMRLDGHHWYVYSVVTERGTAVAGQRAVLRRHVAEEISAKFLMLLLALILLMAVLLHVALRRGLSPLDDAARQIARRSAASLQPLDAAAFPRELQPLTEAINRLMAQLEETLGAQQRFVADAAHELRTPITALQLQLQWLQQAGSEHGRARALAELSLGVERAGRMVAQLLDLSRTPGRAEPPRLLELDEAAVAAIDELAPFAHARRIALERLPGWQPFRVRAAPTQLRTILVNLLDNALRYTPPGGHVGILVQAHGSAAAVTVRDNGPGIAPAERERVFERFYRVAGAGDDADAATGSGLGLALVRLVVEQLHGRIELADAPGGRGLEVRVTLPAADQSSSTPPGAAGVAASGGSS